MLKRIKVFVFVIGFFLLFSPSDVSAVQTVDGIEYPSISSSALQTIKDYIPDYQEDDNLLFIFKSNVAWTRNGVYNARLFAGYCEDYDITTQNYPDYFKVSGSYYVIEQDYYSYVNSDCELYLMTFTSGDNEVETINQIALFNDYNQTHQPGQTVSKYGTNLDEFSGNPAPYLVWTNQALDTQWDYDIPSFDTSSSGSSRSWTPNPADNWIEYYDSTDIFKVYSSIKCYIDTSTVATTSPLVCDGNILTYQKTGDEYTLIDNPTSYTINTPDAPTDYCTDRIASNYALQDENGNYLCKSTDNSATDELTSWFDDKVDEINNEDWGTFEFLKNILVSILESIRNAIQLFANVVLPDPEDFSFFSGSVQQRMSETFPEFDITGLSDLANEDESSTLDIEMFGQTYSINFASSFLTSYRYILASLLAFLVTISNIQHITKMLGEYDTSDDF